MTRLVAPAKLTLGLRITGLRHDGYHLIDAEMVTLDFHDTLEVRSGSGLVIEGPARGDSIGPDRDNLVLRALRLIDRDAAVTITKRIPAGAGLGGGSADAAAILRWAGFTDLEAAAALGADVAFCLVGGRARVTGIGEQVAPLPFVEQTFTLVTPPVFCSTPAVYSAWDDMGGPVGANGNDLEPAALVVAPELVRWRDELAAATDQQPRLAGSGSTWFVEGAHPEAGRIVTTVPTERPVDWASQEER
ncbi:MAG: 4-(cytidine 5'-diphospho)-2-C-methyl-D-erythritol kinase [Acidimicrobiales bacterium]